MAHNTICAGLLWFFTFCSGTDPGVMGTKSGIVSKNTNSLFAHHIDPDLDNCVVRTTKRILRVFLFRFFLNASIYSANYRVIYTGSTNCWASVSVLARSSPPFLRKGRRGKVYYIYDVAILYEFIFGMSRMHLSYIFVNECFPNSSFLSQFLTITKIFFKFS